MVEVLKTKLAAFGAETVRCIKFLRVIGLDVEVVEFVPNGTIIRGVMLVAGSLHLDSRATPSELLHEAGHLATMPPRFRNLLDGDIKACDPKIEDALSALGLPTDHPLTKAVFTRNDNPATAWSWAAGRHLGLPEDIVIRDEDHSFLGKVVRDQLVALSHRGIAPLAEAGICDLGEGGYPEMRQWVQDVDL